MARLLSLTFALVLALARPAAAGMVTLVFDDGLRGVHEYALPILKRHGLPAVSAVIVERLESDNADYMRPAQLRELEAAGWEIASHGATHRRIIDVPPLYADEAPARWRADPAAPGMVQAYVPYAQIPCVAQGGARLAAAASPSQAARKPGLYFFDRITGELHVNPLPGVAEMPLACSYEREMDESRRRLKTLGFDAESYVVPYNYMNDAVLALGRRYYANMASGYGGDGLNHRPDRHGIIRSVVHEHDSAAELIGLVEREVRGKDAWLVLCLHDVGGPNGGLGWEPWPAAELEAFAAWLKKSGVPVVTLKQGAQRVSRPDSSKP